MFIMEISIPGKMVFVLNQDPGSYPSNQLCKQLAQLSGPLGLCQFPRKSPVDILPQMVSLVNHIISLESRELFQLFQLLMSSLLQFSDFCFYFYFIQPIQLLSLHDMHKIVPWSDDNCPRAACERWSWHQLDVDILVIHDRICMKKMKMIEKVFALT